jgi:hypothetical protein
VSRVHFPESAGRKRLAGSIAGCEQTLINDFEGRFIGDYRPRPIGSLVALPWRLLV